MSAEAKGIGTGVATGSTTPVEAASTAAIPAGGVILAVFYANASRTATIADNSGLGLSWQLDAESKNSEGSMAFFTARCPAELPSGTVVTATMTAAGGARALALISLTGLATAGWKDRVSALYGAAAGAAWESGETEETSQAAEIAIGAAGESDVGATTSTPGEGWAELQDFASSGRCLTTVAQTLTGKGKVTAKGTFSSSAGRPLGMVVTYKVAEEGEAAKPQPLAMVI